MNMFWMLLGSMTLMFAGVFVANSFRCRGWKSVAAHAAVFVLAIAGNLFMGFAHGM